eukprot:2790184-Amphidinium_carterae.2
MAGFTLVWTFVRGLEHAANEASTSSPCPSTTSITLLHLADVLQICQESACLVKLVFDTAFCSHCFAHSMLCRLAWIQITRLTCKVPLSTAFLSLIVVTVWIRKASGEFLENCRTISRALLRLLVACSHYHVLLEFQPPLLHRCCQQPMLQCLAQKFQSGISCCPLVCTWATSAMLSPRSSLTRPQSKYLGTQKRLLQNEC